MKRFMALSLSTAALALAACGDDETTGEGAASAASEAGDGPSIAVLSPFPRNDGGITELTISGAEAAAKSIEGASLGGVVDNATEPQAQVRGLRNLAAENDIVVAASGSLNQATDTVAPQFPDTRFIQLVATTESFHENVTSVVPQLGLNAVVAGAVMANRSESKALGVVAGLEIPASMQEVAGVTQGSQTIAPAATVASTFTGDYNDVGAAKQAAEAQMADSVDQLLGDLDSGIRGLEQAAAAGGADVYQVFKLDCDASETVVGSAWVDFAALSEQSVTRAADDDLAPGALFITLASPKLMSFRFCPGRATKSDEEVARDVTEQLNSGELEPAEGVLNPDPGYESVTE